MPAGSNPKRLLPLQTTNIGQVGGAGAALAKNTIYQAASDGYIYAYVTGSTDNLAVYVDTVTPPVSKEYHTGDSSYSPGGTGGMVKKGEYWKVTCTGTPRITWRPLK
jgi:hypothetical protein